MVDKIPPRQPANSNPLSQARVDKTASGLNSKPSPNTSENISLNPVDAVTLNAAQVGKAFLSMESKSPIINLKDGEIAFYQSGGKFQLGGNTEDSCGMPLANPDETIVGKNSYENLEGAAAAGACRIVVLYNEKEKLGALIHIRPTAYYSDGLDFSRQFIIDLLSSFPAFQNKNTKVVIFGNFKSWDKECDENASPIQRKWHKDFTQDLKTSFGFKNTTNFTSSFGNDVSLNTRTGEITVTDDFGDITAEQHISDFFKIK